MSCFTLFSFINNAYHVICSSDKCRAMSSFYTAVYHNQVMHDNSQLKAHHFLVELQLFLPLQITFHLSALNFTCNKFYLPFYYPVTLLSPAFLQLLMVHSNLTTMTTLISSVNFPSSLISSFSHSFGFWLVSLEVVFFFFVLVFKKIHKHFFILKPNNHGMYGITKLSLSIQLCIWLRSGKGTVTTITPLVTLL